MKFLSPKTALLLTTLISPLIEASGSAAEQTLAGHVTGGGAPLANSAISLWSASEAAPVRVAEAQTDKNGNFALSADISADGSSVLYLIAEGGQPAGATASNPAIALMATLGTGLPETVTVNELTTVASVWTAARFLDGTDLQGKPLGLKIAAGNVPNLVDLKSGGLGGAIQDPLNSNETTTLAKVNTLALLLGACVTEKPGVCGKLFEAATPPGGKAPKTTLSAAQNIARAPWHDAAGLFQLFQDAYPVPEGDTWRDTFLLPYLNYAPSAWTLSLVFSGGGLNSLGGIAIDGEGNMWADDNFLVGAQSTIYSSFGGGLSKIAPDGTPLSPMTTGFRGGGIDGPGFGIAISADDKVWATSLAGRNIVTFDRKTGKPISPKGGYSFDGQLGQMQGIIVTPSGDVWALDNEKDQIVHMPGGDPSKGRILGRTVDGKPEDGTLSVKAPFHLAIDHEDRIWITNSGSNTVTRFPASDPAKAEEFEVGYAPRAVAIDSDGNAWVANTVGHPGTAEKIAFVRQKLRAKAEALVGTMPKEDRIAKEWIGLYDILNKYPGGSVSMIRPDGTVMPPIESAGNLIGPWGVAIDGDDNIWIANSTGRSIAKLCGVKTQNCPPGMKTGDLISPDGGFVGGLQILTDIAVDPAGNLWAANNWNRPDMGFMEHPEEAYSTRFGGNGTVIFYGLAEPVRTPLIGPVQRP